jgi:hypothetical protein
MWSAGRSIVLSGYLCVCLMAWGCLSALHAVPPMRIALPSIIRIGADFEGKDGHCTAFSVNETPGRWVTAGHCAQGDVRVGQLVFRPLAKDALNDLALLETDHGLPPLLLGAEPREGDPTMAIGYPASSESPMAVPSVYQGTFKAWSEDTHRFAIFVGNSMPGMSGGPILDRSGRVVSVVLGGGNPAQWSQNVGFGTPYQALRKMIVGRINLKP